MRAPASRACALFSLVKIGEQRTAGQRDRKNDRGYSDLLAVE